MFTLYGLALCAGSAAIACLFLREASFKVALPIFFLVVITIVAIRFGFVAGLLGTIAAGLLFSLFLFEPLYSFAVSNDSARNNLFWMCLGGLALSELFSPPPAPKGGNRPKTS